MTKNDILNPGSIDRSVSKIKRVSNGATWEVVDNWTNFDYVTIKPLMSKKVRHHKWISRADFNNPEIWIHTS